MVKNTILIVDAAPSSNGYFEIFSRMPKGFFLIINIIKNSNLSDIVYSNWKKGILEKNLDFKEVRYEDINKINFENILYVLLGADNSFDVYCDLFLKCFPQKKFNYPLVRSNKLELYNFLKENRLVSTNQQLVNSSNISQIKDFSTSCVLKPLQSLGGKNTFYVSNLKEISNIVQHLKEDFILMDRIYGTEYSVDFVSSNGVHKIHGIWEYTKNLDHHHREEITLVDPNENHELVEKVYNFLVSVFTTIDHKDGPTHSEIIINSSGINLIEINFRLHGHLSNDVQTTALGVSQARLVITNFLEAKWGNINIKKYDYYQPVKKILLNNKVPKYINEVNWEKFSSIESVVHIVKHDYLFPGFIGKSTCAQDSLGYITLTNKNQEDYMSDIKKVRSLKDQLCL